MALLCTIVCVTMHIALLYFITFALLYFTLAPAAVQFTRLSVAGLFTVWTITF